MGDVATMKKLFMTACSDPVFPWVLDKLPGLEAAAAAEGFEIIWQPAAELPLDPVRVPPALRARLFEEAYRRDDIDAVIDLSGGTLAIEMLPLVDWELVGANPKPYLGLSDLTCVISALQVTCGRPSVYWKPVAALKRGFGYATSAVAGERIIPEAVPEAFRSARFSGGNLSKFLSLAGTRWWPDTSESVLFIEGLSTSLRSFASSLAALQELGVLVKLQALALGQFTDIDRYGQRETMLEIAAEYSRGLPIFEVCSVGHSPDSAALSLYQN